MSSVFVLFFSKEKLSFVRHHGGWKDSEKTNTLPPSTGDKRALQLYFHGIF